MNTGLFVPNNQRQLAQLHHFIPKSNCLIRFAGLSSLFTSCFSEVYLATFIITQGVQVQFKYF